MLGGRRFVLLMAPQIPLGESRCSSGIGALGSIVALTRAFRDWGNGSGVRRVLHVILG